MSNLEKNGRLSSRTKITKNEKNNFLQKEEKMSSSDADFDSEEFPLLDEKTNVKKTELVLLKTNIQNVSTTQESPITQGTMPYEEKWCSGVVNKFTYSGNIKDGKKHGKGVISSDIFTATYEWDNDEIVCGRDVFIKEDGTYAGIFNGKILTPFIRNINGEIVGRPTYDGIFVASKNKFVFKGLKNGIIFERGTLTMDNLTISLHVFPSTIAANKFTPYKYKFICYDKINKTTFYGFDDGVDMFFYSNGIMYSVPKSTIPILQQLCSWKYLYSADWGWDSTNKIAKSTLYNMPLYHINLSEDELIRMTECDVVSPCPY